MCEGGGEDAGFFFFFVWGLRGEGGGRGRICFGFLRGIYLERDMKDMEGFLRGI